jgi:hypothetical protein
MVANFEYESQYFKLVIDPGFMTARFTDGSVIYLWRTTFQWSVGINSSYAPIEGPISQPNPLYTVYSGEQFQFFPNDKLCIVTLAPGNTVTIPISGPVILSNSAANCGCTIGAEQKVVQTNRVVLSFKDSGGEFDYYVYKIIESYTGQFYQRFLKIQGMSTGGDVLENYMVGDKYLLCTAYINNYETLSDVFR